MFVLMAILWMGFTNKEAVYWLQLELVGSFFILIVTELQSYGLMVDWLADILLTCDKPIPEELLCSCRIFFCWLVATTVRKMSFCPVVNLWLVMLGWRLCCVGCLVDGLGLSYVALTFYHEALSVSNMYLIWGFLETPWLLVRHFSG